MYWGKRIAHVIALSAIAYSCFAAASEEENHMLSVTVKWEVSARNVSRYELASSEPGHIAYRLVTQERLVNAGKLACPHGLAEVIQLVFSELGHASTASPGMPDNATTTNDVDPVLREPVALTIVVADDECTRKVELAAPRGVFQAQVLNHMPTLRKLLGDLSNDQPKMYRFNAFMESDSTRQVLPPKEDYPENGPGTE